ncbi:MAG: sigma 54-dependent Fis family transcriptional regulator [Myxococcales bacterium]|nr:sigma 54-dependent Fis family transcriptional regulator [Myxococcales bacterium]
MGITMDKLTPRPKEAKEALTTLRMDDWSPLRSSSMVVRGYTVDVVEGPHEGLTLPLNQEITEVGRSEIRHIPLAEDKRVSSLHCEILLDEHGVRVRDLESRNGMFLEGHRILDAYWRPNTRLQVGRSVLVLKAYESPTKIQVNFFDDSAQLVGKSEKMRRIFSLLARLGQREMPVLLTGETGTGKTSIAQALHEQSLRKHSPLVTVNCAAIPATLIEAEFFGYEQGAFTGATRKQHKGYFEQAHGGTLFLDEIGDLPFELQVKLLDAIERRCIRRLGGLQEIQVDFRLIAATNHNLRKQVAEKKFREDLFYRLAVVEIEVPPLRERIEDMPLLVELLLSRMNQANRPSLTEAAYEKLASYYWPGNIRQLRNTLERACVLNERSLLDAPDVELPRNDREMHAVLEPPAEPSVGDKPVEESVPSSVQATPVAKEPEPPAFPLDEHGQRLSLKAAMEQTEARLIRQTVEECQWNVSEAARVLELNRSWLYNRMNKYGIHRDHTSTEGEDSDEPQDETSWLGGH